MNDLEKFIIDCEKNSVPDKDIDLSDIPEVKDLSSGRFRNWKPVKKQVSIRLDIDNINWLKNQTEKGSLSAVNDVIRWARSNGYKGNLYK